MKFEKDPHPMSLKSAEIISSVIIILVLGGPAIFLIIYSARNGWNLYQLFGGLLMLSTAFALVSLLFKQK